MEISSFFKKCLGNTKQCLGVSKNRGIPKSSILIGFSIINHPLWGTPIFGNTRFWNFVFLTFRDGPGLPFDRPPIHAPSFSVWQCLALFRTIGTSPPDVGPERPTHAYKICCQRTSMVDGHLIQSTTKNG